MTAPVQIHDYLLMALQMTIRDNKNAMIVDLNYGQPSEITSIWSQFQIHPYQDDMNSIADCVVCLDTINITTMPDVQEKVERVAKDGAVAFICFTDETVNIFEWFTIQQIYTYATPLELRGGVYFNVMTIMNVKG